MPEDTEMLLTLAAHTAHANGFGYGKKAIGKSARKKNRAKNKAARIARRKNR